MPHPMSFRVGACLFLFLLGLSAPAAASRRDAVEHVRAAEKALAEWKPRVARVELLNAIKSDPGFGQARLLQARTYLLLNDGIAAEAELARAREAGIPLGETRHLMGLALAMQGQPQRALAEITASDIPGWFAAGVARVRGRALTQMGEAIAAERAFHSAVRLAPRDPAIWTDLARFRMQVGDLAGAAIAVDNALTLERRFVDALVMKALVSRQQLGLLAAMPWFERALVLDPVNLTALVERAATLGDLGRMREMLAATREVLRQDAANPQAFYLQAVLAARSGNFSLARAMMLRTKGVLDGNPASMLLYAVIEYQAGNYEQTVDQMQRLLAFQPDNIKARRILAAAHWRTGDAAGVLEALQPVADLPHADSYALMLAGRAHERLGDRGTAARYLDRAMTPTRVLSLTAAPVAAERLEILWRAARNGDAWTNVPLVRALIHNGRNEEALQVALGVQRAAGGAPQAHLLVGDVLDAMGRLADARAVYRRAASIGLTEPVALRMISVQRRLGDARGAYVTLDAFLRQNPQSVAGQLLAADFLLQIRAFGRTIPIYEGLRAKLGDSDAMMLNNLAWSYAETGRLRAAVVHAARAYRLAPANPAIADTYGWLLVRTRLNAARGVVLIEQAVAQAPHAAAVRWHLAQAYALTRQPAKARRAAMTAMRLPGFADRGAARALLARL